MAKKAANRTFTSLLVIVTASILLSACIAGPGGVFLQSVEKDQELGRQVAKQVTAELGIVEEPTTTAYLRELGHRLGRAQADQRFQYSFVIGHEIIHVSRRDTARPLAQARGFGLLSPPGKDCWWGDQQGSREPD